MASPLLAAASNLIADASASLVTSTTRFRHSFEVPVAEISADPEQPRRYFAEGDIAGLAATMAEQGQLQPVLLRRDAATKGRWVLVAGERRWRAARMNGWSTLLAMEAPGDAEVVTILENLQRVDLSPVEEARGLQRLIRNKQWSQDRAAEMLGKSKAHVSATLRILTLPTDLLDRVLTSELPLSRNALVELSRKDVPTQEALLGKAREEGLTVQAIRAAHRSPSEPDSLRVQERRRGRRGLDVRLLDAATDEIEAVIRDGVTFDEISYGSLERLRSSVESLWQAAGTLTPDLARQEAPGASRLARDSRHAGKLPE